MFKPNPTSPSPCSNTNCFALSTRQEIMHHLVYSVLAVVASMALVYYYFQPLATWRGTFWQVGGIQLSSHALFHLFHFPHVTFACATSFLTTMRLTNRFWMSAILSTIFPMIFCSLSDILLPYVGGKALGIAMTFHICLFCNFGIVALFVAAGLALGALIFYGGRFLGFLNFFPTCAISHFVHEFFSGVSSLVYIAGFGFFNWYQYPISILILMTIAVVLPCVTSDFLAPTFFANLLAPGKDCHEKC